MRDPARVARSIALVLASAVGLACAGTPDESPHDVAWQAALGADTIEAYLDVIEKYPGSDLVARAESKIDDLSWQRAIRIDTSGAYTAYLDGVAAEFWLKTAALEVQLPGNHVAEARARLAKENAKLAALDFDPRWLVHRAQAGLREWGHEELRVDGVWGRATRRALRAFQSSRALAVSGRLDDATKQTLGMEQAETDEAGPGVFRLRSYGTVVEIGTHQLRIASRPEGERAFSFSDSTFFRRHAASNDPMLRELVAGQRVRVDYSARLPGLRLSRGLPEGLVQAPEDPGSGMLHADRIWLLE